MKCIHEKILLNSTKHVELINITREVQDIVDVHSLKDALINISTKHTTSAIIINEDEKGLKKDLTGLLEKIVPENNYYHDRIDNNARSHLMSLILNGNQTLPIADGKIGLGRWQSIFFLELDGARRNRIVDVTILY